MTSIKYSRQWSTWLCKHFFSHFLHDNFFSTKHQSTYLKQPKVENTRDYFLTTKANSSEQKIHEKQELAARIIKAKHSTHINEEQECFMKKRSVSLSQTSMQGSNLLQRQENKT